MKYIGNCSSIIDWPSIVESISAQPGDTRDYRFDFCNYSDPEFLQMKQNLDNAGYNKLNSVGWNNYYPGVHFSQEVVSKFETYVNATPLKVWISCVPPGKYAPWHHDVNDKENEYQQQGKQIRFICNIGKPVKGQVLVVKDEVLHLEEQGSVYQWDSYRDWHGGGNCSFSKKYLFNFLGLER